MDYPIEDINRLAEIMKQFTEGSNEVKRFTDAKITEIEQVGKGMGGPRNQSRILSEIATFINGQNARRKTLNAEFEQTSQRMMQSIELKDEPILATPKDKQAFVGLIDALQLMQDVGQKAKQQFISLGNTYARSKGYQADLTKAYQSASNEMGVLVRNLDRVLLYTDQELKIGRRILESS